MATNSNTALETDWNISNDIYEIVDSVNNLQKRYIEDEQESTLALGIYGFLADTEAKKIQTAVVMTGKLGNEMFPTRAQLTKNVLTHAIYNNIGDINAVPAQIVINIGIKTSDISSGTSETPMTKFIFEASSPIFIGDYEFHTDYDIIITKTYIDTDQYGKVEYSYSAQYDMTEPNRISDINNQYLKQPFVMPIGNDEYLLFQVPVRQCSITTITDKITSNSLVENKTYLFTYENQLVDFDVYITDATGEEIRLTPLINGSSSDNIENFCWYLYIDENSIRITFDSRSIVPVLNSNIRIKIYTTLGSAGNFRYTNIDSTSEGSYTTIKSDKYSYDISAFIIAVTDSVNGKDRKTKEELQQLIPKAALSRGSITTETDVNNYFNLLNSETYRMVLTKKVDNQLNRIWYGYFLLKDELNNIIPTNTINIKFDNTSRFVILDNHGKYIIPAGTIIKYDADTLTGELIDESDVPEPFTSEYYDNGYYYYMTIYNTIINPSPLFSGYTSTVIDKNSFFKFDWSNQNAPIQFVANRCNFKRKLLEEQNKYRFEFAIAQSASSNIYRPIKDDAGNVTTNGDRVTTYTNNTKAILVLYNDNDEPYRWVECKCDPDTDINYDSKICKYKADLKTNNMLDDKNKLKLVDNDEYPLMVAGYSDSRNDGYFQGTVKAKLYVLCKFVRDNQSIAIPEDFGRYDLDNIAPVYNDVTNFYTVTNVYEVSDGLQIYEQFTDVVNTKIDIVASTTISGVQNITYGIVGIPAVGYHYVYRGEEYVQYLLDAIYERKAYIDYCLRLLENNMDIDFKFFNTYGPSSIYYIGDNEKTLIGHVDLTFKFRVSLFKTTDINTKQNIINSVKDYIEDLYDTGNWDAPSMITQLMNEYSDRVNFIEFMCYNNFRLGVQHIWKLPNVENSPLMTPEFLNIRNILDNDGNLVPDIEVELI